MISFLSLGKAAADFGRCFFKKLKGKGEIMQNCNTRVNFKMKFTEIEILQ